MENEDLNELKREMLKEIDGLRREYKSFKRRTGVIANMIIPGIGFIIYGSSYLKGIIIFILFVMYNLLYFIKLLPHMDGVSRVIFYIPAVAIWYAGIAMVGKLDD